MYSDIGFETLDLKSCAGFGPVLRDHGLDLVRGNRRKLVLSHKFKGYTERFSYCLVRTKHNVQAAIGSNRSTGSCLSRKQDLSKEDKLEKLELKNLSSMRVYSRIIPLGLINRGFGNRGFRVT